MTAVAQTDLGQDSLAVAAFSPNALDGKSDTRMPQIVSDLATHRQVKEVRLCSGTEANGASAIRFKLHGPRKNTDNAARVISGIESALDLNGLPSPLAFDAHSGEIVINLGFRFAQITSQALLIGLASVRCEKPDFLVLLPSKSSPGKMASDEA